MTDKDFERLLAHQTSKEDPGNPGDWKLLLAILVPVAVVALAYFFSSYHASRGTPATAAPTLTPGSSSPTILYFQEPPAFADDRVDRIHAYHGEVVAFLTVPGLKLWHYPVRYGITLGILAEGPGLYPGSAAPGEGNFSMAGHRITPVGPFRTCSTGEWGTPDCHGPFRYVDRLHPGDIAKVLYQGETYHYTFEGTAIVGPSNTSVLRDGRADMTFTACHPPGYATQRIISQWKLDG